MTAAERLVRALHQATQGRPHHWRILAELARSLQMTESVADRAAEDVQRKGWMNIQGGHSLSLTDAGQSVGR